MRKFSAREEQKTMIVYLNERDHWSFNVPRALQPRMFAEHEEAVIANYKIRPVAVQTGVMRVDISSAQRVAVFEWLQFENAVCVDVEPADISTLLGRSPLTFAVAKALETNANARQMVTSLRLDEIMDRLDLLSARVLEDSNAMMAEQEARARNGDVVAQGMLDADIFMSEIALEQAGFKMPAAVDLDPPPPPQPDNSQFYEDFGATEPTPTRAKDPWRFNLPDDFGPAGF
jgi:hypothetical protein